MTFLYCLESKIYVLDIGGDYSAFASKSLHGEY